MPAKAKDETGFANLVVFQGLFDQYRKPILQSRLLMVEGQLQREGEVMHVIVSRCYNLNKLLRNLTAAQEENLPLLLEGTQKEMFPSARNFKYCLIFLASGVFQRKSGWISNNHPDCSKNLSSFNITPST